MSRPTIPGFRWLPTPGATLLLLVTVLQWALQPWLMPEGTPSAPTVPSLGFTSWSCYFYFLLQKETLEVFIFALLCFLREIEYEPVGRKSSESERRTFSSV